MRYKRKRPVKNRLVFYIVIQLLYPIQILLAPKYYLRYCLSIFHHCGLPLRLVRKRHARLLVVSIQGIHRTGLPHRRQFHFLLLPLLLERQGFQGLLPQPLPEGRERLLDDREVLLDARQFRLWNVYKTIIVPYKHPLKDSHVVDVWINAICIRSRSCSI